MENTCFVTKVNNGICSVEKTVPWVAFSVMLALLIIQVVCRYVFNWPLAWAEEMVRYTYIAVSFIGATVATRERTHISINILPNLLKTIIKNDAKEKRFLNIMDIVTDLITVVFWIFISYWIIGYNIKISGQITTCNQWPMWLMCLPVTLSCMLMGIHSFLNSIEKMIELKNTGREGNLK